MRTPSLIFGLTLLCACGKAQEDSSGDTGSRGPEVVADFSADVLLPPPKLDVLWVIDNSASMCQEQRGLVEHLQDFIDALPAEVAGDLRMAVTTTDVLKGQGVFSEVTATHYPMACSETRILPCVEDSQCQAQLGEPWICNPPPTTGGGVLLENKNGSLNSSCTYICETDHQCCGAFCPAGNCGECTQTCVAPGGGSDVDRNCVAQPLACEGETPGDWSAWARCHLQPGADQSFTAGLESGIKAAWMALDPEDLNAAQAGAFLRPDASLLIVFVSDEDDCSISEEYCGPNFDCEDDSDCAGYTRCEDGLCCGIIKKDYYNLCALLGEYQGAAHHQCAYDLDCRDCDADDDCDQGWACTEDGKCRPKIFGFKTISSVQEPAGTPIFSLARVADYGDRIRSLKEAPQRVLVAAVSGDALVSADNAVSMITEACLAHLDLDLCQGYQVVKDTADPLCVADPGMAGCEEVLKARQDCARQCYVASSGDLDNPQAKSSYVCIWDGGSAGWGGRYARLAALFGDEGLALNICAPDGFGPVMQQLGEFVAGAME
ncbi:MAG: hypothetical protein ABIK09_13065 [Pseudomonadota bacterium]